MLLYRSFLPLCPVFIPLFLCHSLRSICFFFSFTGVRGGEDGEGGLGLLLSLLFSPRNMFFPLLCFIIFRTGGIVANVYFVNQSWADANGRLLRMRSTGQSSSRALFDDVCTVYTPLYIRLLRTRMGPLLGKPERETHGQL